MKYSHFCSGKENRNDISIGEGCPLSNPHSEQTSKITDQSQTNFRKQ